MDGWGGVRWWGVQMGMSAPCQQVVAVGVKPSALLWPSHPRSAVRRQIMRQIMRVARGAHLYVCENVLRHQTPDHGYELISPDDSLNGADELAAACVGHALSLRYSATPN